MNPRFWAALPWALVAFLTALSAILFFRLRAVTEVPPLPPSVLTPAVDSALVAEWARAAARDSARAETQRTADSLMAEQERRDRADAARRAATRALARSSDSLAALAAALGDTVGVAWTAFREKAREADALRLSLAIADSARAAEEARARLYRAGMERADSAVTVLTGLTRELRLTVDRAAEDARDRERARGGRVRLALACGWGATYSGGRVEDGPTCALGLSKPIF